MGGKEFTLEVFLERARKIHGLTYDYGLVNFSSRLEKVCIKCPIHGIFEQTPAMHVHSTKATGCPECGKNRLKEDKKDWCLDEIRESARLVHGDKYEYLSIIRSSQKRLLIRCKKHGEFEQTVHSHLKGHGCFKCSRAKVSEKLKDSYLDIIKKARLVHGTIFDYLSYDRTTGKLLLVCKKHGKFQQNKGDHLNGAGCPECAKIKKSSAHKKSYEELIERFNTIHDGKYEYGYFDDVLSKDVIDIVCKTHGTFQQTVKYHLQGQGCPRCAGKYMTTNDFIEKSKQVHGTKYDYSLASYTKSTERVKIICKNHGEFWRTPGQHLYNKAGCPTCMRKGAEKEISLFLMEYGIQFKRNSRKIVPPYELDIYIPKKKIAIEFNGLWWHTETFGKKSRTYHLNKTELCRKKGIRLIHIFEDEWVFKKEICKSRLLNLLGLSVRGAGARKHDIKRIEWKEASKFLEAYHLQSKGTSGGINYGSYLDGQLVSVMTFGKRRLALGVSKDTTGSYELLRFASNGIVYPGIASRLLFRFITEHEVTSIVSYSDNRWSDGNLYQKLGFIYSHESPPSYFYVKQHDHERFHRFNFRKQIVVEKLGGNPALTEYQNMLNFGYDRIWDCGTKVWVYTQ